MSFLNMPWKDMKHSHKVVAVLYWLSFVAIPVASFYLHRNFIVMVLGLFGVFCFWGSLSVSQEVFDIPPVLEPVASVILSVLMGVGFTVALILVCFSLYPDIFRVSEFGLDWIF